MRAAPTQGLPDDDEVLFFDDVCRITKIPEGTLRHLRLKGEGPPFARKGRRLRIRRSALMRWWAEYDNPDQ